MEREKDEEGVEGRPLHTCSALSATTHKSYIIEDRETHGMTQKNPC